MTSNIHVYDNTVYWTTNRLTEELYLHLMKVTRKDERDGSVKTKYVEQARYLLYRIPVHKPIPMFDVSVDDLSNKLKSELENLDGESLDDVMKGAIGRIFENIDERYYLLSVKKLLRWRLMR